MAISVYRFDRVILQEVDTQFSYQFNNNMIHLNLDSLLFDIKFHKRSKEVIVLEIKVASVWRILVKIFSIMCVN